MLMVSAAAIKMSRGRNDGVQQRRKLFELSRYRLAHWLNTANAAKEEKRRNLVTPLYIEAPLENPLLFLQRPQVHLSTISFNRVGKRLISTFQMLQCYTFVDGQHILGGSCCSSLPTPLGSSPAADVPRLRYHSETQIA